MNKINFIFDLDGTLIDSYPSIVERIFILCNNHNLNYFREEIKEYIIRTTVYDFIKYISEKHNLNFDLISKELDSIPYDFNLVSLMKETLDLLNKCREMNVDCYIYTHRSISTFIILDKLNIRDYFKDIITYKDGFKVKPDPEALNYLISKYKLDKNNTYYIGDRSIDVQCANNAKIKSVYYDSSKLKIDVHSFDHKINNLLELINLIK